MSAGWPLVRLGDLVEQVSRGERVLPHAAYRLLGVRLDGNGPFLRETKLGSESAASTLYRVETGDFVYSRLFAWRGAFGLIPQELSGCFVSNEFPIFRTNPERLDARFLYLWFRLPSVLREVEARCEGATPVTRNRFKEAYFRELTLPLPPLAEQRRIVARLVSLSAKLDEVARIRREIADQIERTLTALFREITEDAPRVQLGDVAPLVRRPVPVDPQGSYSELGVRSFGRGTFPKPALGGFAVGDKRLFRIAPGDLVFNIVFAWEGAVAVAQREDEGRVGSHRFLTFVADRARALPEFLWFHFTTEAGLLQLGEASPGGAGRNRTLGLQAAQRLLVPLPPLAEQRHFVSWLERRRAIDKLRDEVSAQADALLPTLLDRAFAGAL